MAKTKLYTFNMSLYGAPTKQVVKMASLVVMLMPSSNLNLDKFTKSYNKRKPTTASRLVVFVYSLCITRDMSAIDGQHN